MPRFSRISKARLLTCHSDLQRLMNEVIKHIDITVFEGRRGEQKQNEYFDSGASELRWPDGNHNKNPSTAVDIVPYPLDWDDIERFRDQAHFVKGVAAGMGIGIVSGGLEWTTLKDWPHFELKDE